MLRSMDRLCRALSIRQPFAELILRGQKTIEYRSRPTKIVGERFWIYATKGKSRPDSLPGGGFSHDLALPIDVPPWVRELSLGLKLFRGLDLPRGLVVGTAVIEKVTPPPTGEEGLWQWHLAEVERLTTPRVPTNHPQPAWFRPF
jgi:hypothetical protein